MASDGRYPELPFYHLQTNGVWEIEDRVELRILRRSKNPLKSELKKFRIAGGFTDDVFRELKRRPELVRELAREILAAHFRVLSASLRDRRDLG